MLILRLEIFVFLLENLHPLNSDFYFIGLEKQKNFIRNSKIILNSRSNFLNLPHNFILNFFTQSLLFTKYFFHKIPRLVDTFIQGLKYLIKLFQGLKFQQLLSLLELEFVFLIILGRQKNLTSSLKLHPFVSHINQPIFKNFRQISIPFYPQFIQKTFRPLEVTITPLIKYDFVIQRCQKQYNLLTLHKNFFIKFSFQNFKTAFQHYKNLSSIFQASYQVVFFVQILVRDQMNVDLDKYVRNFRIFYSKVVLGHPDQPALEKKFKALLENQASKWRSGLFVSNSESTVNSVTSFLSKTRTANSKTQVNKKKYEWLMETNNFSRAFIFICIMFLLQVKSKEGIQMIRAHLENEGIFQQGRLFHGMGLRKLNYGWAKIQKLFANTINSKPHVSLAQSLNQFPDEFIDSLFDIMTDKKVKKIGVGQVTQEKMNILIDTFKINLTYFEFQNNKIQHMIKCGNFKKNLFIGYLLDQKIYVVSKELPKKQRDHAENKTLKNFSQISNQLFKMYENSSAKIKNLDCVLNSSKARDSQIFGLPLKSESRLQRKGSLATSRSRF